MLASRCRGVRYKLPFLVEDSNRLILVVRRSNRNNAGILASGQVYHNRRKHIRIPLADSCSGAAYGHPGRSAGIDIATDEFPLQPHFHIGSIFFSQPARFCNLSICQLYRRGVPAATFPLALHCDRAMHSTTAFLLGILRWRPGSRTYRMGIFLRTLDLRLARCTGNRGIRSRYRSLYSLPARPDLDFHYPDTRYRSCCIRNNYRLRRAGLPALRG